MGAKRKRSDSTNDDESRNVDEIEDGKKIRNVDAMDDVARQAAIKARFDRDDDERVMAFGVDEDEARAERLGELGRDGDSSDDAAVDDHVATRTKRAAESRETRQAKFFEERRAAFPSTVEAMRAVVCALEESKDTASSALARLSNGPLADLTEAVDFLLLRGVERAYSLRKSEWIHLLCSQVGEQWYEYRLKSGPDVSTIHGPFRASQMQEWRDAFGYFGKAKETGAYVRRVTTPATGDDLLDDFEGDDGGEEEWIDSSSIGCFL